MNDLDEEWGIRGRMERWTRGRMEKLEQNGGIRERINDLQEERGIQRKNGGSIGIMEEQEGELSDGLEEE